MSNQVMISGRSAKGALPSTKTNQIKRSKRQRKSRNRAQMKMEKCCMHLSRCATDYARAIIDPFAIGLQNVCIPDDFDQPSYKFSVKSRFTVSTGINSVGFIACGYGAASDAVAGYYSGPAYANSATEIPSYAYANTVNFSMSNIPWTKAYMANYRKVGHALRLRYRGTELNRGGYYLPVQVNGTGDSIVGASVYSTRTSLPTYTVDRKWHNVSFRPTWRGAYDYSDQHNDLAAGGQVLFGVLIQSAAASQPFECEVIEYFEALPSDTIAVQNTTVSHSDAVGFSFVRNFVTELAPTVAGTSVFNQFVKKVGETIVPAALSAATSYIGGGPIVPPNLMLGWRGDL